MCVIALEDLSVPAAVFMNQECEQLVPQVVEELIVGFSLEKGFKRQEVR